MKFFTDIVKKYGVGLVLATATLDGYRRQVMNDYADKAPEKIQAKFEGESEQSKREYAQKVEETLQNTKNQAAMGRYTEAADEHKKCADRYTQNPTESYNKDALDKSKKKLEEAYDEIKKLDISDYFISLYNKYSEFLDSLSADKIVCLFNLIIDGLILSSFFSVLSIMLSENIINQIDFLNKYPKILKLLRFRNFINKKVSKLYLLTHFIFIIFGILGNIYIFFI